eukprot:s3213_g1.t1
MPVQLSVMTTSRSDGGDCLHRAARAQGTARSRYARRNPPQFPLRSILKHREEKGGFKDRQELLKIKGFGPKSFQQAAGFLRIFGGSEPLDALPIHPESYAVARSLQDAASDASVEALAVQFGVGVETMRDIRGALAEGATSDPRRQEASLRIKEPGKKTTQVGSTAIDAQEEGITASQLTPQMRLLGVVKNVVAFGAFVDVGVGHDGLLHISNYPPERPGGPSVNDQVEVTVLSAERRQERGKDKWRIGLTMKSEPSTLHRGAESVWSIALLPGQQVLPAEHAAYALEGLAEQFGMKLQLEAGAF